MGDFDNHFFQCIALEILKLGTCKSFLISKKNCLGPLSFPRKENHLPELDLSLYTCRVEYVHHWLMNLYRSTLGFTNAQMRSMDLPVSPKTDTLMSQRTTLFQYPWIHQTIYIYMRKLNIYSVLRITCLRRSKNWLFTSNFKELEQLDKKNSRNTEILPYYSHISVRPLLPSDLPVS